MEFAIELEFITSHITAAFERFAARGASDVRQKGTFDLVTEVDVNIETFLTEAILEAFPGDRIHGEELSSAQPVEGRTWVIDPIDGTVNFAHGIPLYGIQCCLFVDEEPKLAVIYLPRQQEMYTAVAGYGCFLNGEKVTVDSSVTAKNAVISTGDFTHKSDRLAAIQYRAVGYLYPRVAKLRMYGTAAVDFGFFVTGRLSATVFTTRNLWDIAPGILMSKEAGGIVLGLDGKPYDFSKDGVMVCANEAVATLMTEAFSGQVTLYGKGYKGVIFDFDGVLIDTERYHYRAWAKAAELVGYPLTWEEYLPLKSTGMDTITNYICDRSGKDVSQSVREEVAATKLRVFNEIVEELSEEDVLPGVRDFLSYLNTRQTKTAVASSSSASAALAQRFDLSKHFQVIIDGNRKLPRKPAPDTFLLAAQLLGVEPRDCIVFEDSLAGIDAACNAGMPVVAVGGIRSEKALAHIEDFRQLGRYF